MTDATFAPWTAGQVVVVAVANLTATITVGASALAARGRDGLGAQLTWVEVAVAGLLLLAVTNGYLFLLGRRAVGRRRARVLPDVLARTAAPAARAEDGPWLWLPGTARAHVAGCPMIAGKPAKPVTTAAIRSKALRRCEVC